MLRDLGVPLARISHALRGPAELAEVLAAEENRLERDIDRANRSLLAVRRILDDGGTTSPWRTTNGRVIGEALNVAARLRVECGLSVRDLRPG